MVAALTTLGCAAAMLFVRTRLKRQHKGAAAQTSERDAELRQAVSRKAAETDCDPIVFCGVRFMVESARVLARPEQLVFHPNERAGCPMADMADGESLVAMKQKHPGAAVVTYVNSTAEVKAETDICCTSSNAVEVVESLGTDRVIFLPDEYLGKWVASQTDAEVIL